MKSHKSDKLFLLSVVILVVAGFFIFSSASLGLLARSGAKYSNVAFSQLFYGLLMGSVAFLSTSKINYKVWKKYAFYLFIASAILTLLVFVPHIGFAHGGAKRWIALGPIMFQPSEFLKIGFIIYFAAWISSVKQKITTFKSGLVPFIILLGITGLILLAQPDTDTFIVVAMSGVAMFIVGGGKWKHVALLGLISIVGFVSIAMYRPYLRERIYTFMNPGHDSLGSSYQIQQSLIAIGSGGLTGRGFGQSIQKFNFLPEPIGDSIFAVMAEEFGLVGGVALIFLYLFFTFRGFKIATHAPDVFGRLVVVGIVILVVSQSFINIGAMLGVLPLSGIPLLFVSHGGTALFITLAEVGIILNISKYQQKTI